jgi:hypothetical protein
MTDHKRTVINAALRASTHRIVRLFGLPGAIAILAAVFGPDAWKARRDKKLARKRKAEADTRRLAWRRKWYPGEDQP